MPAKPRAVLLLFALFKDARDCVEIMFRNINARR